MDIDKKQILAIIRNNLSVADIKRSIIYWHKSILAQGEQIEIGLKTVTMPFWGTIVFVDLAPRANWAHPCLYMLIDIKTHRAKIIKASLPPNIDESNENYIIILRFGQKPPHEHFFSAFDK